MGHSKNKTLKEDKMLKNAKKIKKISIMNNSSPSLYPLIEANDKYVFSLKKWASPSYSSSLPNHCISSIIPYFSPYLTDTDSSSQFDPFYSHEYYHLKQQVLPNKPIDYEVKYRKDNFASFLNERPHGCDFPGCGRFFKRLEHVKRHYRSIHTKVRPYLCPHCPKTFSRSDNLSQHSRTHRPSQSTESTSTSKPN